MMRSVGTTLARTAVILLAAVIVAGLLYAVSRTAVANAVIGLRGGRGPIGAEGFAGRRFGSGDGFGEPGQDIPGLASPGDNQRQGAGGDDAGQGSSGDNAGRQRGFPPGAPGGSGQEAQSGTVPFGQGFAPGANPFGEGFPPGAARPGFGRGGREGRNGFSIVRALPDMFKNLAIVAAVILAVAIVRRLAVRRRRRPAAVA
jgi:hypothetical protein